MQHYAIGCSARDWTRLQQPSAEIRAACMRCQSGMHLGQNNAVAWRKCTQAWSQFHTARKAVEGIKDDMTRLMEMGQVQWASGDREGALRHCAFLLQKIGDDESAAPFALHAQAMVLHGEWLAQLRTENPKVIIQNVCA